MLLGSMILISALTAAVNCLCSGVGLHWLWVGPLSLVGTFLGLAVLAFLFLWIACLLVDQNKPQEHDSKFHRTLIRLYGRLVLTVGRVRVHTRGFEQAPGSGRFFLVCNHLHEADPVILMQHFPKSQLAFITKREAQKMFLVGPLMHKILCQPVNRENDREALKTIINCIRLIKEDEASVAVFPEGYIKPDRKLHRFRSGVFKIATKTNVPIVVCTITNTHHIIRNITHLKPTDVDLHLLKVIEPQEYAGKTTVELADEVYRLMAGDLGPDRVSQEEIA